MAFVVEIVAPSSAGKSTLVAISKERLISAGMPAISIAEAVIGKALSRLVDWPAAQNVLIEFRLAFHLMRVSSVHAELLAHCHNYIQKTVPLAIHRASLKRSIRRRLAISSYLSTQSSNEYCVLVDEGPLNIPQVLFANGIGVENDFDAVLIARLLPLPSLIVSMSPGVDVLLKRAQARPDSPLLLPIRQSLTDFLVRALFATNAVTDKLRTRAHVIDLPDTTAEAAAVLVEKITEFKRVTN